MLVRVHDHREFRVWHAACELTEQVYLASKKLPRDERFGLMAQMRDAAISVASNIAEGASRSSDADFARFLDMAAGSTAEIDTQLHLCERLGLLPSDDVETAHALNRDVRKMLSGLMRRLRGGN